jgi:hypothetical protein
MKKYKIATMIHAIKRISINCFPYAEHIYYDAA